MLPLTNILEFKNRRREVNIFDGIEGIAIGLIRNPRGLPVSLQIYGVVSDNYLDSKRGVSELCDALVGYGVVLVTSSGEGQRIEFDAQLIDWSVIANIDPTAPHEEFVGRFKISRWSEFIGLCSRAQAVAGIATAVGANWFLKHDALPIDHVRFERRGEVVTILNQGSIPLR